MEVGPEPKRNALGYVVKPGDPTWVGPHRYRIRTVIGEEYEWQCDALAGTENEVAVMLAQKNGRQVLLKCLDGTLVAEAHVVSYTLLDTPG